MRHRCSCCGTRRNVSLFGNDPRSFQVRRGIWPAGNYLCSRCVALENVRAFRGKRSPRMTATMLRILRRFCVRFARLWRRRT